MAVKLTIDQRERFFSTIKEKSDKVIQYTLIAYFIFGLFLATFYNTYSLAIGVGALCLIASFLSKAMLPKSTFYQYVVSTVLAVFSAQFIYQMHGLFEMHFFVFIGTTLLITYQNWKLQLPLILLVVVHHATFAYLQYSGLREMYFTQLDYMDLQAFLFHGLLAAVISFICGYWSFNLEGATIENAQKTIAYEKQIENVRNNIAFADEISKGNLGVDYKLLDDSDILGKSLMTMRRSLVESNQREQEEKFITIGITKIGEIIQRNNDNVQKLSDEFVSGMVKYLGVNQGGLFLVEETETEKYLKLTACYAYERKKFLDKRVAIGESLIGQCYLERDSIYMTKVPQDYVHITSGLGESTPGSILLMPLMTNEEVVGVLELASFKPFTPAHIQFIKRASENIASSIISSRITERVKKLLQESQEKAEIMRSQEEEMRQNMEELQATQEEMERKQAESNKIKMELATREEVLSLTTILSETDSRGVITYVNDKFCEVAKFDRQELINSPHSIVRHPDMPKALFKLMWDSIKSGRIFQGIVKNKAKDGSAYWVDATIVPVKKDGEIDRYIGARYHIKDEKWARQRYEEQMKKLGLPLYS